MTTNSNDIARDRITKLIAGDQQDALHHAQGNITDVVEWMATMLLGAFDKAEDRAIVQEQIDKLKDNSNLFGLIMVAALSINKTQAAQIQDLIEDRSILAYQKNSPSEQILRHIAIEADVPVPLLYDALHALSGGSDAFEAPDDLVNNALLALKDLAEYATPENDDAEDY